MISIKKSIRASCMAMIWVFASTSAFAGNPLFDAHDAYERGNYNEAYAGFLPIAKAGNHDAQLIIGFMYYERYKWTYTI